MPRASVKATTPIVEEQPTTQFPTQQMITEGYVEVPLDLLSTKGHPLIYGENVRIFSRPFTVTEVKRLALMGENIKDKDIDDIMNHVIKLNNGTYFDIAAVDKLNLVFWTRTITYPEPEFVINYYCDNPVLDGKDENGEDKHRICKAKDQFHFSMDDVDIDYIKDDLCEDDFKIKVNASTTITIRMSRIADQSDCDEMLTQAKKIRTNEDFDREFMSVACLTVAINDQPVPNVMTVYDMLKNNLSPAGYIKFSKSLEKLYCGINTDITVKCKECGGEVELPVMFSPDFFLPDYRQEGVVTADK